MISGKITCLDANHEIPGPIRQVSSFRVQNFTGLTSSTTKKWLVLGGKNSLTRSARATYMNQVFMWQNWESKTKTIAPKHKQKNSPLNWLLLQNPAPKLNTDNKLRPTNTHPRISYPVKSCCLLEIEARQTQVLRSKPQ